MRELVFVVSSDEEGGYIAKTRLDKGSIVTQGDTISEVKAMVLDAVSGYFFDKPNERPETIKLHFEEVIAFA